MKKQYIAYYISELDFTHIIGCIKQMLEEIENPSRFDTYDQALERIKALPHKKIKVIIH